MVLLGIINGAEQCKGFDFFFGAVAGGYHKFIGLIEVTELPWGDFVLDKGRN